VAPGFHLVRPAICNLHGSSQLGGLRGVTVSLLLLDAGNGRLQPNAELRLLRFLLLQQASRHECFINTAATICPSTPSLGFLLL
jgi:hypothetical protein